jgi:hypothetical protein
MEELYWSPDNIAERIRWKRIGFLHEDFEQHSIDALEDEIPKKAFLKKFLALFPDGRKAELEALPPDEIRARVTLNIENALGEDGVELYREDEATEATEREELETRVSVALSD